MGLDNESDVAVGAETPAPTESTETTPAAPVEATQTPAEPVATPSPLDKADPWDGFGEDAADDVKADEPAEPAKDDDPADTPDDKATDKPITEDEVLEELLADDDAPAKTQEQKDAELDSADPEEMAKGQRNKVERDYLSRTQRYAKPLRDFKLGSIGPEEALDQLAPIMGADKITAIKQAAAHALVDANPDDTFRRAYVIKQLQRDPAWDYNQHEIPTLDQLLDGAITPNMAMAAESDPELEGLIADLDKQINWDWRDPEQDDRFVDDRERAMAKTIRGMEAKAEAAAETIGALQKSIPDPAKVADAATSEFVKEFNSDQTALRISIEDKFTPWAAKKTELAPSPDDTPEIAAYKQRHMELCYTGSEYEKAQGHPSRFETFAYNESSVGKDLMKQVTHMLTLQKQATEARLGKDEAAATSVSKQIQDERVPLFTLLAQANKEFAQLYIDPYIKALGMSSARRAAPLKEASQRVEVVSNAGSAPLETPPRSRAATADDVWGEMVTDARKDDALRSGA